MAKYKSVRIQLVLTLALFCGFSGGCSAMDYRKTVAHVDINKFMGDWYVIGGRFTFLEEGAHNAIESYKWDESKKQIQISFNFNQDSFDGKVKSIPQKGWIYNNKTNAHWKVSPFWPLKFDYLVIALADDYSWTAIGVPSGKYLWIMAREHKIYQENPQKLDDILKQLEAQGYPVNDVITVPHEDNK